MIKGNVLASALTLAVTAIACVFGSVLASRLALGWLSLRQVLDRPNERSSHSSPVPRGGGIGFATVILVALAALYGIERQVPPAVLVGALSVSAISFADDLRPVSYRLRFLVQAFAVTVVLALLPADTPIVTDSLPIWLDRLLVGLAWLWFINLFNFMDGIDGIAAGEAVVIAGGALGLALLQTNFGEAALPAIIIAASAAAFLAYNWHPAKLFMGDVGSTALGFFLGWLLIEAAAAGFLAAAFILPMFFLVDASSTLIVRAIRGRPLATAHRHHAYQVGVDRGLSQGGVAGAVMALGLVLIGLAMLSPSAPIMATIAALTLSGGLVAWLRWGGRNQLPGTSSR